MNIKKIFVSAIVVLGVMTTSAYADGVTISGTWSGAAFPSAVVDLNNDGVTGRTFDVRAYQQLVFGRIQGVIDIVVVAPPGGSSVCRESEFELEPFGHLIFHTLGGNSALYAEMDSSVHLCFDPADPNEMLALNISGGRGIFANTTGTGTAIIRDTVISTDPTGQIFFLIDTEGDFTLNLN